MGSSAAKDAMDEDGPIMETGDLVLLRMNTQLSGIAMPPSVAAHAATALLGDNPALRRLDLPAWDRVCVLLMWGYNERGDLVPPSQLQTLGSLVPCVAVAYTDCLQVHLLSDILEDSQYTVVGLRQLDPPLRETLEVNGDDIEANRAGRTDWTSELSNAVWHMKGRLWTELARGRLKADLGRPALEHDNSIQVMFTRLRKYTACLHEMALENKYAEAEAATIAAKVAAETKTGADSTVEIERKQPKKSPAVKLKWFGRRNTSAVEPEPPSDTEEEEEEEQVDESLPNQNNRNLARLRLRSKLGKAIPRNPFVPSDGAGKPLPCAEAERRLIEEEERTLESTWIGCSNTEWTQLVCRAMNKEVSDETAMSMQVSMCREWNLSIAEAETALLMVCGRFDLGAQLAAEVVLHLYRRAGLIQEQNLVGHFWTPSTFDPKVDAKGKDRIQKLLPQGRTFLEVEILRHEKIAQRSQNVRSQQRWEKAVGYLSCKKKQNTKIVI